MPITTTYGYTANSELLSGYSLGDFERQVTYEPNRNLPSSISNLLSPSQTTLSRFDYTNDDAGRPDAQAESKRPAERIYPEPRQDVMIPV
jgi:hypothetical protein